MKPYVTEMYNDLDPPTPLPVTLRIEFEFEQILTSLDCVACCIREFPCKESGKQVRWLHCKAVFTDDARSDNRVPPRTYLIPVQYITRARPGIKVPGIAHAPENAKRNIGVFPANAQQPIEALPLGEIQRALAACQRLRVAAPLFGRMYNDFVGKISAKLQRALVDIEAVHNFEHGEEFEVSLCKVLGSILPQGFGICRGYVLNSLGETAGNDIVIFDRMRFPTFRGLAQEDYSTREQVPIEAVYAYIEAKHTLDIEGNSGTSLTKAITQVSDVKMACAHRMDVTSREIVPHIELAAGTIETPKGWPNYRNPIYGAIISRNVRIKPGGETNPANAAIMKAMANQRLNCQRPPDLIVAGSDCVTIPSMPIEGSDERNTPSPFFIEDRNYGEGENFSECSLQTVRADNIAFGVGIGMMLWALDWIQLGEMPWPEVLTNAINSFENETNNDNEGRQRDG